MLVQTSEETPGGGVHNSWRCHLSYRLMVNLREWALAEGFHPETACRWYRQGKLQVPSPQDGQAHSDG